MKKAFIIIMVLACLCAGICLTSCTPHRWFIVNSEGILTYDRNKGTFELLWQNSAAGHSPDSGSIKVDSIMFGK